MAKKLAVEQEANAADPLDINVRLYRQVAALLDDLEAADLEERMTIPQRISALIAIGRIQIMFNTLRKGAFDAGYAGSAVRKYATAFSKANAARGRAGDARSANVVEFDGAGGGDEFDDG